MVQCDRCDLWFHFVCVVVDGSIATMNWSCDECRYELPKTTVTSNKENVSPNQQWRKTKSVHTLTSISSSQSKTLALQRLEEERQLNAKRDQEYLKKKYSILEGSIDERFELGEDEHNKASDVSYENTLRWAKEMQRLSDDFTNKFTTENVSISMSENEMKTFDKRFVPTASSSANVQRHKPILHSDEVRKLNSIFNVHETQIGTTRRNPIQSSKLQSDGQVQTASHDNVEMKQSLNEQATPKFGKIHSKPQFDLRVTTVPEKSKFTDYCSSTYRNDLPKLNFDKFGMPSTETAQMYEQSNQPLTTRQANPSTNFGQTVVHQPVNQQVSSPAGNVSASNRNVSASNQQAAFQNIAGGLIDYKVLCQSAVNLTPSQIASRHTMDKKYPQFFGDPMKWQMFESAFVNATESCGLNNAENLSRLLDCLKGDALEAVQCRLLHSRNVPGIMETLRLLFGRPELVIQTLLDEINKAPAQKPDDLASFVKFAILVQNLCSTVTAYHSVEHLRNPMLLKDLVNKLPTQIKLNWACYKITVADVNLSIFADWIYMLATVASDVITTVDSSQNEKKNRKDDMNKNPKSDNYVNSTNTFRPAQVTSNVTSNTGAMSKTQKKCSACKKDICKKLAFCETFKKLTRQGRWNLVKSNNLCGCCLGNHRYSNCSQKVQCGIAGCSYFHHVLLHNENKDVKRNTDDRAKQNSSDNGAQAKTCNAFHDTVRNVQYPEIFRIVPVKLFFNGKSLKIYAYLDDGSNVTTIELSIAHKLGLYGTKESLCVKWSFGEAQMETESSRISVQISGVHDGAETFTLDDVRTVKQLNLPQQSITSNWLQQFPYLNDIPITPYNDAVPQMIIGLRFSKLMVSLETIEGNWEQPIACKTRLGWVVQGPNDKRITNNSMNTYSLNMCECQSLYNNLHRLVKEFFSLEAFGVKLSERIVESKAMMRARHILETSTVKHENHYTTALLWRSDDIQLPNSYDMAMRRLECVETKMKKNPILSTRMCDYLKDFLDKGYIRKLTLAEQNKHGPRTWYLPIFPVFNPKKPEKLRLVWDGAAKVNGVSLNSQLLTGPDQLVPLPDILRRFREAFIGVSTDIIEMYHRVHVEEEDQNAQRFFWRDGDDSRPPDVYVITVLPFGLTCSPAIAQFVKNKNAKCNNIQRLWRL